MLSETEQDILRHKLRGKLAIHRPKASRPQIEAASDAVVLKVRGNDDRLSDMMMNTAVQMALRELEQAV